MLNIYHSTFIIHHFPKLTFLFFFFPFLTIAQPPCLTQLSDKIEVQQQRIELVKPVQQWIDNQLVSERNLVTIPVVIHVVWHEAEEDISDAQIESQLTVLNDAFRARLSNLNIVPDIFQDLIADTEIEFCLAQRTPTNQSTNGIERVRVSEPAIVRDRPALFAASPLWNPNEYLNIYVVNLAPNVDGDAIFPAEATTANDAIRINYRSFGTVETAMMNPARSGGKSLVHEVGHYLGLRHIWGSEEGCTFDDFAGMDDTPLQSSSYLGQCPTGLQSSCGTPDMYMNFMDYSDDDCLAMFTPDQKAWMLGVLNTTRTGLLDSRGCDSVVNTINATTLEELTFWYDASRQIINIQFAGNQTFVEFSLFDVTGKQVAKREVTNQQEINWQLSLTQRGVYYLQIAIAGERRTYSLFFY